MNKHAFEMHVEGKAADSTHVWQPDSDVADLQAASGSPSGQNGLLQLQRTRGNRYVQGVMNRMHAAATSVPIIQTKLVLGAPDDKYEREADHVAQQVAGQQDIEGDVQVPTIQRLSAAPGAAASTGVGQVAANVQQAIQSARGGGQPLPTPVRNPMERAMGADFGGVRMHTDTQADGLNESFQAQAFTTGNDIFFRRGAYSFDNTEGRQLLAHELTHVVQQHSRFDGETTSSQQTSAQVSLIQCGKKGKKRKFTELSEDKSELTEDESEVEAQPPAKRFRPAFNPLSAQPRKNDSDEQAMVSNLKDKLKHRGQRFKATRKPKQNKPFLLRGGSFDALVGDDPALAEQFVSVLYRNLPSTVVGEPMRLFMPISTLTETDAMLRAHYNQVQTDSLKVNRRNTQRPQDRTELTGEAMTADYIRRNYGDDYQMLLGFSAGTGIDQVWRNDETSHYLIVEAKGPGAQLKGADWRTERGGAGIAQMSPAWIANRLRSMGNSQDEASSDVYQDIVTHCGLKETGSGKLLSLEKDSGAKVTHTLSGVTVTMQFDEKGVLDSIHKEASIF